MKHDIKNRWTGNVQFTAEIECDPGASASIRVGLAVRWAVRTRADLTGADLTGADLARAYLAHANLTGAYLTGADLTGADLTDAYLAGADLAGADLRGADHAGADLAGADLTGADLAGADLRGAILAGAPVIPDIHKAVYAAASAPDALNMSEWHTSCGTAHCRAGWVVTLAGPEGKKLEERIGTPAAATAIYLASDPTMTRFPDFYCTNSDALADMKARAEAK